MYICVKVSDIANIAFSTNLRVKDSEKSHTKGRLSFFRPLLLPTFFPLPFVHSRRWLFILRALANGMESGARLGPANLTAILGRKIRF